MPEGVTVSVDLPPGVYRWSDLASHCEAVLAGAGVASPAAEARWLLERAAGERVTALSPQDRAPARAVGWLLDMLERRVGGEPLQYVLGRWAFRHLDLLVDHRVLIPRPETEVTAEVALEEATRLGARRAHPDPWAMTESSFVVADLGTGSGALALALADELADAEVWASDASPDALAVARANLASIGLAASRVRLVEGSWFAALPDALRGRIRLVVSNPPYVAEGEVGDLPAEVRDHEPRAALVAGPRGTESLEIVIGSTPAWLAPQGALVCEIAPHQAGVVVGMAREAGFSEVELRPDLAGHDRVLVARR